MPLTYRIFKVWRRDLVVWKKYLAASLVANFGEPFLYLVAMGYGLGRFVQVLPDGSSYVVFIAPALLVISVMQAASFETTFSSYTRMETQKTFHAIAMTPVSMHEVVGGEILWAATKAMITSSSIFVVLLAFQLIPSAWVLLMPLLMLATGLVFASIGMLVTSFARSYDFFSYYFTLFLSPMFLFSGTFFPIDQSMPVWARTLANFLPLTHSVRVARHFFNGNFGLWDFITIAIMLLVAVLIALIAMQRLVRRMMV